MRTRRWGPSSWIPFSARVGMAFWPLYVGLVSTRLQTCSRPRVERKDYVKTRALTASTSASQHRVWDSPFNMRPTFGCAIKRRVSDPTLGTQSSLGYATQHWVCSPRAHGEFSDNQLGGRKAKRRTLFRLSRLRLLTLVSRNWVKGPSRVGNPTFGCAI